MPATLDPTKTTDCSAFYGRTFSALEQELAEAGVAQFHARALWRALYREMDLAERTDFSPPLRRWIAEKAAATPSSLETPSAISETASSDGLTRKYLLQMRDDRAIETVLMGYTGRHTACLSTQVGCAMGCVFCATGQMSFVRHLGADEIVAQVLHCQRALRSQGKAGLRNLVLMGMGEPLNNYDAVMTALEIITDTRGLNIGPGHITISTVGIVPGILRLASEQRPYHLAVSLHGATEGDRSALVPASRKWPLHVLMDACRTYGATTGRKIFFEWTLIRGVNDSEAHAATLAELLRGISSHVNLIPLNPTTGFDAAPSSDGAPFQQVLKSAGIPSTVRQRRGIDVNAGCGQLATARR